MARLPCSRRLFGAKSVNSLEMVLWYTFLIRSVKPRCLTIIEALEKSEPVKIQSHGKVGMVSLDSAK